MYGGYRCYPLQPHQKVVDHFRSIGLVEDLVPGVVVDADDDIGEAGVAVTVDEWPQQSEVGVDGVLGSDRDIDGQVVGNTRDLGGVRESPSTSEHFFGGSGIDAEAAQRISEIRIDDSLVAGQPVEVGARRLERPR